MTKVLKGMLEVPMVDGQSEDICGNDDRIYVFGRWVDFCGTPISELQKYNACCGDSPEPGPTPPGPTPPTPTGDTQDYAFRFGFIPYKMEDEDVLTDAGMAELVEGNNNEEGKVIMELIFGRNEQPLDPNADVEESDYVYIEGADNMSDEEFAEIAPDYTYDIIFAFENKITNYAVTDEWNNNLESDITNIGTYTYNGVTYEVLRYSNMESLCYIEDARYEQEGGAPRHVKIIFTKL